jgi:hypothetical protein
MTYERSRRPAAETERELHLGQNARQALLEFYKERNREYSEHSPVGRSRSGGVYALGIERLETDNDVFESYELLRAAGVEISEQLQTYLDSLTRDWRRVCRIDRAGRVWTATLAQKNRKPWSG